MRDGSAEPPTNAPSPRRNGQRSAENSLLFSKRGRLPRAQGGDAYAELRGAWLSDGIIRRVQPASEEQLAAALAAAVADYATASGDRSAEAIQERLHEVLYHRGSDGVTEVSVSQSESTCTLLGIVIWVEDQTLSPLEAIFRLDQSGAVKAFILRAGDSRVPPRERPAYPLDSWRQRLRLIESRPVADEDWQHVIRYESA